MSWGMKASGTKENVKAVIDDSVYIPPLVRQMIFDQIDQLSLEPPWSGDHMDYHVYVETHGHMDKDQLDVHIEVRRQACGLKPEPLPDPPSVG